MVEPFAHTLSGVSYRRPRKVELQTDVKRVRALGNLCRLGRRIDQTQCHFPRPRYQRDWDDHRTVHGTMSDFPWRNRNIFNF